MSFTFFLLDGAKMPEKGSNYTETNQGRLTPKPSDNKRGACSKRVKSSARSKANLQFKSVNISFPSHNQPLAHTPQLSNIGGHDTNLISKTTHPTTLVISN